MTQFSVARRRSAAEARTGSPAAALEASGSGFGWRPNRPLRALGGALVVVAAIVAALTIYSGAGDRTKVLALSRSVLAGDRIDDSDLLVVAVASDGSVAMVPATERSAIVGQYARLRLPSGSLLVPGAVAPELPTDPALVRMSIEVAAATVPTGLRERSRVAIVAFPERSNTSGGPAPTVIEGTVVVIPHGLVDLLSSTGGAGAMVALTVEVPAAAVGTIGAAQAVSIGVLEPLAGNA